MSCYLIPIGGTGVRVMKSIVYLCMCGCFPNANFKVMCIDSDDANGNVKELEYLLKNYKDFSTDMFPRINLVKIDGEERCIWSPLSGDKRKDKHSSMRDMIAESQMGRDAKKILQFLYTKEEREKVLQGGFYGHTSIGAYFMAQEVVRNNAYTNVWHDFFDGIKEDDKIFIIGSIFGGTGASGVPTIARLIKDNDVTANIPIGALFVMPYFKPERKDDEENSELPIDWTNFTTKTKTALSFYLDQQFDKIFDTMYFIGEDADEFMFVKYNDCGAGQQNKANPIELFAATALIDYLKSGSNDNLVTKFLTKEVTPDGQSILSQEMLNEIADSDCFNKLSGFLKFSILYNKYLYPCICDEDSAEHWYKHYKTISQKDAYGLKNLCSSYLNWIRDLLIKTDVSGERDFEDENNNIGWFWYKNYTYLYDENSLTSTEKGVFKKHKKYDLEKLEKMNSVVKYEKNSKTGEEIIVNFAETKAPVHNKDGNISDLKQLMSDIIESC